MWMLWCAACSLSGGFSSKSIRISWLFSIFEYHFQDCLRVFFIDTPLCLCLFISPNCFHMCSAFVLPYFLESCFYVSLLRSATKIHHFCLTPKIYPNLSYCSPRYFRKRFISFSHISIFMSSCAKYYTFLLYIASRFLIFPPPSCSTTSKFRRWRHEVSTSVFFAVYLLQPHSVCPMHKGQAAQYVPDL